MTAVRGPLELSLIPSKILLVFRLLLAITATVHLMLLPMALWSRLLGLGLVIALVLRQLLGWLGSQPETVRFYPQTNHWQIDGGPWLQLERRQFVMRSLVILYFRDGSGRRLNRVIPRDSLGADQHRQLRRLLVMLLATASRDG
ncbi:MAG: protein YgfX [Porticoccaceae bacterium]